MKEGKATEGAEKILGNCYDIQLSLAAKEGKLLKERTREYVEQITNGLLKKNPRKLLGKYLLFIDEFQSKIFRDCT